MTRARSKTISLETTPYYLCTSRCVRRAFLCGKDSLTGKNYEHRKTWVVERLKELAEAYAVEVCAFAVMSNHHHVVVRVDEEKAKAWTIDQVIEQWGKLYGIPMLIARYQRGETTTRAEAIKAEKDIQEWRERLSSVSWFMGALNENLARRANEEDNCTGRFWEGRFKCQALLDEAAVLTSMTYVDLNPIRAGIAPTPEQSDFTSISQRIRQYAKTQPIQQDTAPQPKVPLMPLVKQTHDPHKNAIGFTTKDYLELVDWAGRAIREGKRGAISESAPPILERLGLEPSRYLEHINGTAPLETPTALGPVSKIRQAAEALEKCFIKGVGVARRLYSPVATA